jgi:hypothetical protein
MAQSAYVKGAGRRGAERGAVIGRVLLLFRGQFCVGKKTLYTNRVPKKPVYGVLNIQYQKQMYVYYRLSYSTNVMYVYQKK